MNIFNQRFKLAETYGLETKNYIDILFTLAACKLSFLLPVKREGFDKGDNSDSMYKNKLFIQKSSIN